MKTSYVGMLAMIAIAPWTPSAKLYWPLSNASPTMIVDMLSD